MFIENSLTRVLSFESDNFCKNKYQDKILYLIIFSVDRHNLNHFDNGLLISIVFKAECQILFDSTLSNVNIYCFSLLFDIKLNIFIFMYWYCSYKLRNLKMLAWALEKYNNKLLYVITDSLFICFYHFPTFYCDIPLFEKVCIRLTWRCNDIVITWYVVIQLKNKLTL